MRKTTFLKKLEEIEIIIKKCQTCHVAMVDQYGKPYLLPFNFGYDDGVVYLHSDQTGKKIDILKNNPAVCINFSKDHDLFMANDHVACSYGMAYRSVLVYGNVEFITENDKKIEALNIFMKQYVDRDFSYAEPSVKNVCIFKVKIEDFTGKMYHHENLE
ncbi:MAG: pyridoxamine 5'-phosphate oxidase family protein [Salinivirgaceae bacterium]|nr:pyridoxamine 5'-phosphate oxidase family protein [Salinivirgaceae bacterium]